MSINYLDNIRFKIAHSIARFLAKTKITPNQVTIVRFLLTLPVCLYFFSRGTYLDNIIGLILYLVLIIFDWVDGHLARITGKTSTIGHWIDEVFDRILVLIIFGSLFYAGIAHEAGWWPYLAIFFYSAFLFIMGVESNFNQLFALKFDYYPNVEKKVFEIEKKPRLSDRFFLNFLNVHRNSFSKFCFCASYPLLLGIITNQLFLALFFIALMYFVRVGGFLTIIFMVVKKGRTDSVLVKVLRGAIEGDRPWEQKK